MDTEHFFSNAACCICGGELMDTENNYCDDCRDNIGDMESVLCNDPTKTAVAVIALYSTEYGLPIILRNPASSEYEINRISHPVTVEFELLDDQTTERRNRIASIKSEIAALEEKLSKLITPPERTS